MAGGSSDLIEKTKAPMKKISLFTLIMISCAFVVSVRNFPTEAETGFHLVFFALVAGLGFFFPVGLVSAELATGWPKQGGIFVWVREAFGERFGFVSIWLQWTYMMLGSIAMLLFIGGSVAYLIDPDNSNHFVDNRIFLFVILLVVIWGATLFNFRGMNASGKLSTVGFLVGVLAPGVLIILLGMIYLLRGKPVQIDMSLTASNIFPDIGKLTSMVLLLGFMRTFVGIEASASHANEVRDPQRNYPIAIFAVLVTGFFLNVLGSLSVGFVVPQQQLSLNSGLMQAYDIFFGQFHLAWLLPIIGVFIALGSIGGVSTWVVGPVKGVLSSARDGGLPRFFHKVNDKGMPTNLLIVQACTISVIGGLLLLMPTMNAAFWVSNAMAVCVYFFMYGLMLLSALYLRYKEPDVKRSYRVPGGKNAGMWFISVVGLSTLAIGFFLAVLPPSQLNIENPYTYGFTLGLGILAAIALPFVIYKLRKPGWKIEGEAVDVLAGQAEKGE